MDLNALKNEMKEWRHYLHMHPEWALEETVTSDFIANRLKEIGLEVHRNIGVTGIVATLKCGDGPDTIGIRADMDAICLEELGDVPYKSQNPGKMHACGHDGHSATLLGAAKLLSERKNFNGTVHFIFQPGEEPGIGADAMIKDGLFEKFPMDEVYGFHNMPHFKEGSINTCRGGLMASEDDFSIRIKGRGGHSSMTNKINDPLVAAAEIVLALQTVIARDVNPLDPAVISCTNIITNGTRNAIPDVVEISGDTRSTTPAVQKLLEERLRAICNGICDAHQMTCEITYTHDFAPAFNNDKCVDIALKAAENTVGKNHVNGNCRPLMGSEDFGKMMAKVPGCCVLLGSGTENNYIPVHSPYYDYNDEILLTGAQYLAELVKIRLPE